MLNAKVSVIIPAYNEEKKIANTIKALKNIKEIKQIVVIDDCSKDNTGKIAENAGTQVIKLPVNRGKGRALNIGAKYVKENIIALVDADLENTAIEVRKLIKPVVDGQTDLTIAIFPQALKKGGIGLVKNAASFGLKLITKKFFLAPLSGQRVMTRKVFENLLPFSPGFGVEVGMTIDACLKGYRIMEVQTNMRHTETGRNWAGFLHRGRQMKDVCDTLIIKGWR